MTPIGRALLAFVAHVFRSRLSLPLEIAAQRPDPGGVALPQLVPLAGGFGV